MYIKKIPNDAVKIKNSLDYVDRKGNVYGIENRAHNKNKGKPFMKTQSTVYGYKYCGINYKNGKHVTKRVHRLVAEAFIPNPKNYPIVLHKDNNKKNNCVENLMWGTVSDNTKQAVKDGLLINKKGFDDEQSIPCTCYDTLTNKLIGHYGSVSIASKETGISKGGILYQLNNTDKQIKKSYYFVRYKELPRTHDIIVQYDYNTNAEMNRFVTIGKASEYTGISISTISAQITANKKPEWVKENFYFKKQLL